MGLFEEREGKARRLLALTCATFGKNNSRLSNDVLFGVLFAMSSEGLLNADGEAVFRRCVEQRKIG